MVEEEQKRANRPSATQMVDMYDNQSLDDIVPDFVRQTQSYLEQDKIQKAEEVKIEDEICIQQVKDDVEAMLNEDQFQNRSRIFESLQMAQDAKAKLMAQYEQQTMAQFALKEEEFQVIDDPKEVRRGTMNDKIGSEFSSMAKNQSLASKSLEFGKSTGSKAENYRVKDDFYEPENPLQHQLNLIEEWINEALYTFLCKQGPFEFLNQSISLAQETVDEEFAKSFDKVKIQDRVYDAEKIVKETDANSQIDTKHFSLENYVDEFWSDLRNTIQEEYVMRICRETFTVEINQELPDFITKHLCELIEQRFNHKIEDFLLHFASKNEDRWENYVNEHIGPAKMFKGPKENAVYKPKELQDSHIIALVDILVHLPLRQEIKLEREIIQIKVNKFQSGLMLQQQPLECKWQCTTEAMDNKVKVFKEKVMENGPSQGLFNIYALLFTVFYSFCMVNSDYNGADRHMLKVLLETIMPVIHKALNVNEEVDIGFFLTILESKAGTRIKKDKYDIKQLRKLMNAEQKKRLDIQLSIRRCKVLELVRVSPKEQQSKHVIICIAGFLSEDVDKTEEWNNVQTHYKHAEVYALTWTSCAVINFFDSYNLKKSNGKSISTFRKIVNALNFQETATRQFVFAQDQARLAGIMLAIFLLKSDFSQGRAVSLIGFSLGSVVCLNCMRVLKYFYREGKYFAHAGRLLNDVQLWAGAEVIDPKKTEAERMRKSFHCSVVSGRLINCWSAKDTALSIGFPRFHPGQVPVGTGPIFTSEQVPRDEDGTLGCKIAHNVDVEAESPGHLDYKAGCLKFFAKLPQSF